MNGLRKAQNVIERITLVFATISVIAVAFMMFAISADVIGRWITHKAIKGIYELTEMAMAMGVFGAFSYTQMKHGHVHVTLLIAHFPQKMKMASYAVTSLITTIVMFAIAYAAWIQSFAAAQQNRVTSILKIPFQPFYIFEAVAMVFFAIVLLLDTIKCFIGIFNKDVADEIQATWS